MSKKLNKLSLNRETLLPLQADQLGNVNGGTGLVCSAVRVSLAVCSQVVSALACRAGGGSAPQAK